MRKVPSHCLGRRAGPFRFNSPRGAVSGYNIFPDLEVNIVEFLYLVSPYYLYLVSLLVGCPSENDALLLLKWTEWIY